MSQLKYSNNYNDVSTMQWMINDRIRPDMSDELEKIKEEKRRLREEKENFSRELQEYQIKKKMFEQQLDREKKLFQQKFEILEMEFKKLAHEKERMKKEKAFYRAVNEFENKKNENILTITQSSYFKGTSDDISLKKRYKDLIKIFHPDNMNGDTTTLQEINREYEELKKVYAKE